MSEAEDYLPTYVISIDRALKSYDPNKVDFIYYLKSIYLFELYREVGKEIKKNQILFNAISLSKVYDVDDGLTLIELIEDRNELKPSDSVQREEVKLVLRDSLPENYHVSYDSKLIELQRKVLIFRYYGFNYEEISQFLHISYGQIKYLMNDLFSKEDTPIKKLKKLYK